MNSLAIAHLLGWLLSGLALAEFVPLGVAWGAGEPRDPWLLAIAVTALFGGSLAASARPRSLSLRTRDGFALGGLGLALVSVFGALPYFLGDALGPGDALFESVAGFTTTNASVLHPLEAVPRSLLLWRALTQWLGGIGALLFSVGVLPLLPIGAMQIFRSDLPGAGAARPAPRVAEAGRRLGLLYLGLTGLAALALWEPGGLSAFDAVCHAFTAVSTGGFSTREASFAAFPPRAQWIAAGFMWLGGVNLLLLHRAWRERSGRAFWSDGEFRYYVLVLVLAVALVGGSIALAPPPGAATFRDVVFQSVSALTGTGYSSAPFGLWPGFALLVLLQLMVLGGMTGSTSGGVKSLRVLLGLRALRVAFARLLHPRAVRSVKYAGRPVPEAVLGGVWAFLTGYLIAVVLVAAVVAAAGYDLLTALSTGVATLGNIGPGPGEIAPGGGYEGFPAAVKLVLCTAMLAGRIEVFAFLVLASPGFWRR